MAIGSPRTTYVQDTSRLTGLRLRRIASLTPSPAFVLDATYAVKTFYHFLPHMEAQTDDPNNDNSRAVIHAALGLAGRLVRWVTHGNAADPVSPEAAEIVGHLYAGDLTCQICGHWHPEEELEVIHLPVLGLEIYFPADRRNLRHCTNLECLERAREIRRESFSVIPQEERDDG